MVIKRGFTVASFAFLVSTTPTWKGAAYTGVLVIASEAGQMVLHAIELASYLAKQLTFSGS